MDANHHLHKYQLFIIITKLLGRKIAAISILIIMQLTYQEKTIICGKQIVTIRTTKFIYEKQKCFEI